MMASLGPMIESQLRSGSQYRIGSCCITAACSFFGTDKNGLKCTHCAGLAVPTRRQRSLDPVFQEKLRVWVDGEVVRENSNLGRLIRHCLLTRKAIVLTLLRMVWLDAAFARTLLEACGRNQYNVQPSHLILPHVLDWWNIRPSCGFFSYEQCYYGENGRSLPLEVPSQPPPMALRCSGIYGDDRLCREMGLL